MLTSQGRTLAIGETYSQRVAAEDAIDSFRMVAMAAPVIDTTVPAASTAPALGATGTVTWNIGTLGAGESASLQLVAVPTVTGTLQTSVTDMDSCAVGACLDPVTTSVVILRTSPRSERISSTISSAVPFG